MSLLHRKFAISTLSDLAKRETENDTITFTGNYVSVQYKFPVRSPEETDNEYAIRLAKFRKNLPRHSDSSERLALAVEALRLDGKKSFAAADCVREILAKAPAKKKAEYEKKGIGYAFRPIDPPIGTTRRNRRAKRKKRGISTEVRQAESIRAQASRFKHDHEDFEGLLRSRLGAFRFQFFRDPEWFASVEPSYIARAEAFEQHRGPFDWFTAMPVAVAAQFYHEQRKFPQALVYYRKAIDAARMAVMHDDLRTFVLHWLQDGVQRCERSAGMIPMPPYRGPWLPTESPTPLSLK
jgi:hypothetical protein